ncbi:RNA pseudouridine synthase [Treponema sp. OMZ 792]|uniref:pseudouridine synthase family protein n=1 Tax=unclassified Treponema TaxID=2638727 RepID=UPI0020A4EBDF|nr:MULTISPECIES: pseudouridine synthase [unclassified Treponema]UTC74220.1 RNA pseudouridine synthase [Treponema sp. OMZ 792]UTC77496.1 RNA pseudouridine synthase [Treponema sp. OMZ 799]UTC80617.1 RNA pseudouridine synthase [Treponema sp. OMZ 798]
MLINCEFSFQAEAVFENEAYAVLYKPRGMPTAPLAENEEGTLVSWFLKRCPEASSVRGKKDIEAGLIHRLDTATSGLVLIAKNQESYDALNLMQANNLIKKTYAAFTDVDRDADLNPDFSQSNLPYRISSQFRSYGPKGKKVLPVFYGMRDFCSTAKIYTTNIIEITNFPPKDNSIPMVTCTLNQGFRHQVRAHLASIGLPIYGDPLYNGKFKDFPQEKIDEHSYPLQLYAVCLSFPEPKKNFKLDDPKEYVSFSLQPPDKMIL